MQSGISKLRQRLRAALALLMLLLFTGQALARDGRNVWEWTNDCWEGDCAKRVLRGGSWNISYGNLLRSANRSLDIPGYRDSDSGFRVARTLP